jgi:hypothetical protein
MFILVEYLLLNKLGRAAFVEVDGDNVDEKIELLTAKGAWTAANLDEAYQHALSQSILEVPIGQSRALTQSELLHCQRVAVSNDVCAVCLYLCYASDADVLHMTDQQIEQHAVALLHNPAWTDVADQATLFAFSNCPRYGYVPTPERDAFLLDFCRAGGRRVSFPLLQQAWAERKRQEHIGQVEANRNAPISMEELDTLDDASVERTYQQTMRERAKRMNQAAHPG